MIKNIFLKSFTLCLTMVCFNLQEALAQPESSERKLQIVSFTEADKTDFDVTTPSNFAGKLSTTALIKVYMPGEIASTDPVSSQDIVRKLSPGGGGYATYVWVEEHCNSLHIIPKGNTYQSVKINFKEFNIPMYSIRNKNGGLQAGRVYHLVLRDPAPVYIDTHLQGAYAIVDDGTKKIYADKDGRITLRELTSGEHLVNIFAENGNSRGSVRIDDRQKIYTLDARKKARLSIKTNPEGGRIYIFNGESKEQYDPNKEYAYGSYKVVAFIDDNEVQKEITIGDNMKTIVIDNTMTFTLTPMYNGRYAGTGASVFENNKKLEETDDGVRVSHNSYEVTRPIGQRYTYYATYMGSKSPKTAIGVRKGMQSDYQLSVVGRKDFQWPWEREYNPVPVGITMGYVQKQVVTNGGGEKVKENMVWLDGDNKWLSGLQIGVDVQPCLKWGLGIYTGLFYEFYFSSNDDYDYSKFQDHELYIPVHALYRFPFSKKFALWVHGGIGFNYGLSAKFKADDNDYAEDLDYFGEGLWYYENGYTAYAPKRLNMMAEIALNLRIGPVVVGATYSKGLNDHKCYEEFGDEYTSKVNKLSISAAYVF